MAGEILLLWTGPLVLVVVDCWSGGGGAEQGQTMLVPPPLAFQDDRPPQVTCAIASLGVRARKSTPPCALYGRGGRRRCRHVPLQANQFHKVALFTSTAAGTKNLFHLDRDEANFPQHHLPIPSQSGKMLAWNTADMFTPRIIFMDKLADWFS